MYIVQGVSGTPSDARVALQDVFTLFSTSTTGLLRVANNLSDVASPSLSRFNLGLGTAAVEPASFFLQTANNLGDVPNASAARTALGFASPGAFGPVGDSTHVARVTTNALGQVTALTSVAIAASGSSPIVIQTIAALRALAVPVDGTYIVLSSYFNGIGDGGGGIFQFISSDNYSRDNGGTLIVPGGSAPVINATGVQVTPGTAATVGCWHRVMFDTQGNNDSAGTLNVQWFGASSRVGDSTPGFMLAANALSQNGGGSVLVPGTLCCPADEYTFMTKCVMDMHSSNVMSIKGDGEGGTHFNYAMVSADTCMFEIRNGGGGGSMQDIGLRFAPASGIFLNPAILWVHGTLDFSLLNVKALNCYVNNAIANGTYSSGATPGGVFKLGGDVLEAWTTAHAYAVGDLVTNGSVYECWAAVGAGGAAPGSDAAHWSPSGAGNTSLTVLGCGSDASYGTQLYWSGSGALSNNKFKNQPLAPGAAAWSAGTSYGPFTSFVKYIDSNTYICRQAALGAGQSPSNPAFWQMISVDSPCAVLLADTLQMQNNFLQNGGPWRSFNGAAVTTAGPGLHIAASGLNFAAGDWVLVYNAVTNSAYNGMYQVSTASAGVVTLAGQSVVGSTTFISNDTVTISSLWSSLYCPSFRESQMDMGFFNTGSQPFAGTSSGTVAIFIDAFGSYAIPGGGAAAGQLSISQCVCDYGATSVFVHGSTTTAGSPSQFNSSAAGIMIDSISPNGGPRDKFGSIRLEGVVDVQVNTSNMHPGATGATEFDSIVISDGGASNQNGITQGITITGGILTSKLASAQWSGETHVAVTLDGANVKMVSIIGAGVDAAQTVMQLVNRSGTGTPALANGITMLYTNNFTGRLIAIDATRAIPGSAL